MDNILIDGLSDDDLNRLTDMILDRLIERAAGPQWHQYNTPLTVGELLKGQLPFEETQEEALVGQMARLTTLLNMYEHQEEYMKAAIIKRKLDIINNRLNKL